jgi:iron(III) transport system substrate-binding protein
MEILMEAGAVRQFTSANGDELPAHYRDPNRYWVASHIYVMQPGFNTTLVPTAQRPKTYEDLLAPYWKDKMVWKMNDMSGGPGFIGNILTSMGEERGMDYLRKLSGQRIKMVNASARAILDQVIGGEYPMALQIFNHHAAISAEKGAPVDWVRLSPATVNPALLGCRRTRRIRMPACSTSSSCCRPKANRFCRRRTTCRRGPTCLRSRPTSFPRRAVSQPP